MKLPIKALYDLDVTLGHRILHVTKNSICKRPQSHYDWWKQDVLLLVKFNQNMYLAFSLSFHFGSDTPTFLYFSQNPPIGLLWKLTQELLNTCIATCQTRFSKSCFFFPIKGVKVQESLNWLWYYEIANNHCIWPWRDLRSQNIACD